MENPPDIPKWRGCPVDECPVQVGDLIKFVGVARYYKESVGVVIYLYSLLNMEGHCDSVLVWMPNRDGGRPSKRGPNYHPLALEEIVKI